MMSMNYKAVGSEPVGSRLETGRFYREPPLSIQTPYIEIDESRIDNNLKEMQSKAASSGCLLMPHIKTHKSLFLADKQIKFGAAGITASKPQELLVFIKGGIQRAILAYPVVCPKSLDILLPEVLARRVSLSVIAADPLGVKALALASEKHGVKLSVFIKVDVGLGRVGIKPGADIALELANEIRNSPTLRFAGLLSHAGHSYGAISRDQLEQIALSEADNLTVTSTMLKEHGIEVPDISVGASPTCIGAPLPAVANIVRPGNYIFFDKTALRLGICKADQIALSVIATVVAYNDDGFIVDAGSKSLSSDLGPHGTGSGDYGIVVSANNSNLGVWRVERLSEEHGFVKCSERPPHLGSKVRIFPNHACTVMAQFDTYILRRSTGEFVEMPVDARGCQ